MKMSIEDKLKVVRAALEQGADIDINLHIAGTREQAEEVVKSFAPLFNKPYYHDNHEGYQWFKLEELEGDEQESGFELTVHHE
ncbi:hypothetical protein [Priestia flexa]|uniref:hypothetical protein n=1 Tax=Priestia flexa TaxID=86664 RepID=UPI00249079A4|nr:hypothetical protein [Priestia flexa]